MRIDLDLKTMHCAVKILKSQLQRSDEKEGVTSPTKNEDDLLLKIDDSCLKESITFREFVCL